CNEIKRRGLKFSWSAFARVNTVDVETLELMRDAGCDSISFGVESGNQEMLRRIRKGITVEQVKRAVAMCRDVGLVVHCSFIVGLPGETRETLEETKAFAAALGAYYGYHLLAPFPGTTVRDEVESYDLQILTSDWTRYDANRAVVQTKALTAAEMDAFVDDFEGTIQRQWETLIEGYRRGTNDPLDNLRVEGHFRTRFTYRLLSEDILEEYGLVTPPLGDPEGRKTLVATVSDVTGEERAFVERTLSDFIARGYVASQRREDKVRWYWTHNNRLKEFPL
ncbi:MAG: radical SAM protein, partial [Syntrophales bacterium]|nr:radical SAM protein [Syntrophales bacterium]